MIWTVDTVVPSAVLKPSNPKQGTIAEGPSAFIKFFESCHKSVQQGDDSGRPRKRARLDHESEPESSGPSRSVIPIARLDLHLRPIQDTTEDQNIVTLPEGDIEVGIVDCDSSVNGQLRLSMTGPRNHKKSPFLNFESTESVSSHVLIILGRVAYLERRARRNGKKGVSQSSCRLSCAFGPSGITFTVECVVSWIDGESAFGPLAVKKEDWETLSLFYPESPNSQQQSWTPQEFYTSVHSPATDAPIPNLVEQKVLETDLYPFQKRAVSWMLDREKPDPKASQPRCSYTPILDANDRSCFVSHLEGVICSEQHLENYYEPKGGILAEEMGLGKTCELIALICLNKQETPSVKLEHAESASSTLVPSKATLIVTPPTILQQWKDELARHAPALSVLHYKGLSDAKFSKKGTRDILEVFSQSDVVITTYSVLAKEVHFAVDPPERSLRQRERKHTRPRSPLVQTYWWRICLDEAQMVESGVSAAAQVASLLPREHSWAVSGTPLKKDVQDLFGLLIFLRYRPFCNSSAIWMRLIRQYGDLFKQLFGRIALRHTKDQIRHELRLPPQRRIVLTLPFTQVEEQNYNTLFETMCEECGCAQDGSPLREDWNPDSSMLLQSMRAWLCRLRQTCLHPQVGGRNRRALGRGQGPLRTVSEVLEVMIEQNEVSIRTESRTAILTQMLRGHIIGNAKDDDHRAEKALEIYKSAYQEAEMVVTDCRADVVRVGAVEDDIINVDEESDDDKSPEQISRKRSRTALHSALQLQHACAFFIGTAYFQIKSNTDITEPDSDRFAELERHETLYYDTAKIIRKELLKENAVKAERLMRTIEQGKEDVTLKQSRLSTMETPGGVENIKLVC